jgi:CheY-like chemotaxis protein
MKLGKLNLFQSQQPASGPWAMVVDSDSEVSAEAATRLGRLGYRVLIVGSAQEAIASARLPQVEFILLDRGFRGDGANTRQTLAQLQTDPSTARIPRLMTSLRQELEQASTVAERKVQSRANYAYAHQEASVA